MKEAMYMRGVTALIEKSIDLDGEIYELIPVKMKRLENAVSTLKTEFDAHLIAHKTSVGLHTKTEEQISSIPTSN